MSRKTKSPSKIERVAKEKLQFENLRPGQEEAVQSLLEGHDTLVVQPTGSGKSAIYQIAGFMIPGVTLIVSPLIALQKDQVESLNQDKAAEAAVVNSTQKVAEAREVFSKLAQGALEFIFMAPEQLRKPETLEKLKAAGVSLFVIDEAHCISEWGHDFRPDYLHLGSVIEELRHPVVLAMTATASLEVRDEILERLGLRNANVFVHGFDRPNISLRVDNFGSEQEKLDALVHRVRWAEIPGIVYTSTRKNAESIAHLLEQEDLKAVVYHAGMKAKERDQIQEQFMSGEAGIIVATNAFGMGVDKEDVRFVYHFDIPDSLDSYYQEIGRAGRDGRPAEAVLFYRHEDLGIRKFQAGSGKLEPDKIEQVAKVIHHEDGPVDMDTIVDKTELSERKVISALHRLEDVGAVESRPTGEVELNGKVDLNEAAQAASENHEAHKERKALRLEQMRAYAEISTCRREFLLRYFGDSFQGPCGNCDNCRHSVDRFAVDPSIGTRREITA